MLVDASLHQVSIHNVMSRRTSDILSCLGILCCRQNSKCNVFTYCPNFGGCVYGNNQTFPYMGCQLKHQDGNVAGRGVTPKAYARGPPTPFASGDALPCSVLGLQGRTACTCTLMGEKQVSRPCVI